MVAAMVTGAALGSTTGVAAMRLGAGAPSAPRAAAATGIAAGAVGRGGSGGTEAGGAPPTGTGVSRFLPPRVVRVPGTAPAPATAAALPPPAMAGGPPRDADVAPGGGPMRAESAGWAAGGGGADGRDPVAPAAAAPAAAAAAPKRPARPAGATRPAAAAFRGLICSVRRCASVASAAVAPPAFRSPYNCRTRSSISSPDTGRPVTSQHPYHTSDHAHSST